ncbi:MAG: hypothetical protein Q8M24_15575 [Pseudolabrys sp.]|nr:hypothetical protein [Pseudolabrys sp.]MDP2296863.1 hypothetical protein [Pseudolabrys sp.]
MSIQVNLCDQLTIADRETYISDLIGTITSADSDEEVANLIADWYLLQTRDWPRFHLSIHHDVRTRARGFACYGFGIPCPLFYEWTRKNIVGISTSDRARARKWIVEAMCAGYAVFYGRTKGFAGGKGTIASIRTVAGQNAERVS